MQGIITPPRPAENKCRRVSQTETLRYRFLVAASEKQAASEATLDLWRFGLLIVKLHLLILFRKSLFKMSPKLFLVL